MAGGLPLCAVSGRAEVLDAVHQDLVAFVYTSDLDRALCLTERIEAGMLGVNTGAWCPSPPRPSGALRPRAWDAKGASRSTLRPVYIGVRDSFAGQGAS